MGQILPTSNFIADYDQINYHSILGTNYESTSFQAVAVPISIAGILTQFYVKFADSAGNPKSPGTGKGFYIVVIKNGSLTDLQAVLKDNDTEVTKRTMVLVEPGDTLQIRTAPYNLPAQWRMYFSMVLYTSNESEIAIVGSTTDRYQSLYVMPMGYQFYGSQTEIVQEFIASRNVTVSDLRVSLSDSPGTGKSWVFTVRVNEANTSITTTISGSSKEGSDTTNSESIIAGSRVSVQATAVGSPATTRIRIGLKLTTVLPDIFPVGGACKINYRDPYSYSPTPMIGYYDGHPANLRSLQILAWDATLRNFYVELSVPPGTGKSRTATIYKRTGTVASNTGLSVTISGTDTSGSNVGTEVSVLRGDVIYVVWTESGDPAFTNATYGLEMCASFFYPTVETTKVVASVAYGSITSVGDGGSCSVRGFCYMEATEGDPNVFDDDFVVDGNLSTDGEFGTGEYSLTLPLEAGKTYRVRAFAVNSTGIAYGTTVANYFLYPTTFARVSSIRRIYHPGLYRMELALGELGLNIDIPELALKRVPDTVEEPEETEEAAKLPEPLTESDWAEILRQQQASLWYRLMSQSLPTWATHTTTPYQHQLPRK